MACQERPSAYFSKAYCSNALLLNTRHAHAAPADIAAAARFEVLTVFAVGGCLIRNLFQMKVAGALVWFEGTSSRFRVESGRALVQHTKVLQLRLTL